MLYGSCICVNKEGRTILNILIAGYIATDNFTFLSIHPGHLQYNLNSFTVSDNIWKLKCISIFVKNSCQYITTNQTEDPPCQALCFWQCPLTLQCFRKQGKDKANTELYSPLLYSCSFQQTATKGIHAVGGFICIIKTSLSISLVFWINCKMPHQLISIQLGWIVYWSPQTGGWVSGF